MSEFHRLIEEQIPGLRRYARALTRYPLLPNRTTGSPAPSCRPGFVGQITASAAFIVYSWLIGHWVFVVTNALMRVTAVLGQWIYLTNQQKAGAG
jgi:hypothetical protein